MEGPIFGRVVRLSPGIRRLTADNPSPMTYTGTNTYLVGEGDVVLIDPGPPLEGHLAAILAALEQGERIVAILVTHSHLDHSGLCAPLAQATGAPVMAYGDSTAGISAMMRRLTDQGLTGAGEGSDTGFRPDMLLADGQEIATSAGPLRAIHTPGHFGNHLSFQLGDVVFSGDHIMGWSTSIVAPPSGDMGDYMASLARLKAVGAALLLPGHGDPVDDPAARIAWLREHRLQRERQILSALSVGSATARELARRIYVDVPDALLPAAERNVLAHLLDLLRRGRAQAEGEIGAYSKFTTSE